MGYSTLNDSTGTATGIGDWYFGSATYGNRGEKMARGAL